MINTSSTYMILCFRASVANIMYGDCVKNDPEFTYPIFKRVNWKWRFLVEKAVYGWLVSSSPMP